MQISATGKTAVVPSVAATAYDRVFYSGMAIALAVTVFAGFVRTYFLPLARSAANTAALPGLVHLHGALFSGWLLLFIAQTALVAGGRVAVHRRLGLLGVLLAAAMVGVGTATAINAAARGSSPPGVDPLVFMAVPLFDMFTFPGFVTAAVALRRSPEAHKRLMLLATISLAAAGVARLSIMKHAGLITVFATAYLFLAAAVIYDLVTRRRVHPVYIWGGLLLVASVPLRLFVSGTGAWRSLAQFLTGTG
jgi:hypothetical protein